MKDLPPNRPRGTDRNGALPFALSPREAVNEFFGFWRGQKVVTVWIAVALLLVLAIAIGYQVWIGYDVWAVVAIIGGYLLLYTMMFLLRIAAYGVVQILIRLGVYDPLAKALDNTAKAIGKATGFVVSTGVVLLLGALAIGVVVAAFILVQSLSVPVAIVVGAIIIAFAISRSR